MNTKAMYDAKEMLCKEFEDLTRKGNISRNDLQPIEQLTNSIKNIMKICEMEEEGYSYGEGNWNANGSYSNGMMPMSYGRGSYGDERMSGRRSGNNYSGNNYSNDAYDMESRMRREMNY